MLIMLMSWFTKFKKILCTSIRIEFKLIGNNETDLRHGTSELKWQTEQLEKAKNTQGRNIMKDVEVEEWMWIYGKGDKGQTKGEYVKREAVITGEVHSCLLTHSIVWT